MRCLRCGRKLTRPPVDGLGPVCAKNAKAVPSCERDLFGFDIEAAAEAATTRLRILVSVLAAQARIDTREAFKAALGRLGVLA
jgi:hypothetical protein